MLSSDGVIAVEVSNDSPPQILAICIVYNVIAHIFLEKKKSDKREKKSNFHYSRLHWSEQKILAWKWCIITVWNDGARQKH